MAKLNLIRKAVVASIATIPIFKKNYVGIKLQ